MKKQGKIVHLWSVFLLFTMFLTGCGTLGGVASKVWPFGGGKAKGTNAAIEPVKTEAKLEEEAIKAFRRGRFLLAEETFQKIKDRYPFSPYAVVAELRLADCKFYQGAYEEAIPLYEEFEKLHPTNRYIPYAIFQQGTCYYRMMLSPDRDQTYTMRAIKQYERLISRYPHSPYTFEAKRRLRSARERLAAHELIVAKWYIRTRQYRQATIRLKYLMNTYPDTKSAKEGGEMLARLEPRLATLNEKDAHDNGKLGFLRQLWPW